VLRWITFGSFLKDIKCNLKVFTGALFYLLFKLITQIVRDWSEALVMLFSLNQVCTTWRMKRNRRISLRHKMLFNTVSCSDDHVLHSTDFQHASFVVGFVLLDL